MNEIDKKKYMDIINKNKVSTEKKDNNFGKCVKKFFVKHLCKRLLKQKRKLQIIYRKKKIFQKNNCLKASQPRCFFYVHF